MASIAVKSNVHGFSSHRSLPYYLISGSCCTVFSHVMGNSFLKFPSLNPLKGSLMYESYSVPPTNPYDFCTPCKASSHHLISDASVRFLWEIVKYVAYAYKNYDKKAI